MELEPPKDTVLCILLTSICNLLQMCFQNHRNTGETGEFAWLLGPGGTFCLFEHDVYTSDDLVLIVMKRCLTRRTKNYECCVFNLPVLALLYNFSSYVVWLCICELPGLPSNSCFRLTL